MVVLETPRLLLRQWTLADVDPFQAVCADPRVMQFVGSGETWTRARTAAMIETAMAHEQQHGYCRWAVVLKPVERADESAQQVRRSSAAAQPADYEPPPHKEPLIGFCGVQRRGASFLACPSQPTGPLVGFCGFVPANEGAEIGWRLSADCWGRGLATEAARAALRHGFDVLSFPCIIATIQAGNAASLRVAEKIGMQYAQRFERGGREILVFALRPGDKTEPAFEKKA
jgi:[ribosomal protein S5]-alanine N-acetyltransferase